MNRRRKQLIKQAFAVPPPARKADFLKQHRRRELGRREMLLIQLRYIPWWIWGASIVLCAWILVAAAQQEGLPVWSASALTPFLALLVITENGRSQYCQMEELELSCRVSRQSIVLARMTILGLFHLLLLGALAPLLAMSGGVGIVRAGVCLLTPYLLTAALGMELTRHLRGRNALLACAAAAALVSGAGVYVGSRPVLYEAGTGSLWGTVLAVSFLIFIIECILYSRKMRELQWN